MKFALLLLLILLLAAIFAITYATPNLRLVCVKEKTTNTCQVIYLPQGIP